MCNTKTNIYISGLINTVWELTMVYNVDALWCIGYKSGLIPVPPWLDLDN